MNMKEESRPDPHDDEVSLMDIWRVFARWKAIFIASVLLALISAAIYLYLAPPVYESMVVVQIGHTSWTGQLESTEALRERLTAETPALSVAGTKNGNVARMRLQSRSREEAEEQLRGVVEKLLAEHEAAFAGIMELLRQRLDSSQKDAEDRRGQLAELAVLIDKVQEREPSQAVVLALERNILAREIFRLTKDVAEQQLSLIPPQSMPTKLVGEIVFATKPVQPRVGMVLVLSILLGAAAGVVAVFCAEFLDRARE